MKRLISRAVEQRLRFLTSLRSPCRRRLDRRAIADPSRDATTPTPRDSVLGPAAAGRVDDTLSAWHRWIHEDLPAGRITLPEFLNTVEELVAVLDQGDEREAASAVLDDARVAVAELDPQKLARLARLHVRSGRPRGAVSCAEALADHRPDAQSLALLADRLQRARRYDDSLEVLARAAVLEPDAAPLHAARGEALYIEGRYDEAVAAYRRAVAADERPRWLANLGRTLTRLGRDEEALVAFRRSHQLRPSDRNTEWLERLEIRCGGAAAGLAPRSPGPQRMFHHVADLVDCDAEERAEQQLADWLRRPLNEEM